MRTAVMVHGAGGGPWEWRIWEAAFIGADWRVILPDLLPSEEGIERTSFSDYVEQALDCLPSDSSDFALIGASLGGAVALQLAQLVQPSVLVLINSVPLVGLGWERRSSLEPVILWANRPVEESREVMPDCDEEVICFAAERWRDESGLVLSEIAEGVNVKPSKCRTLVISGEEDRDIPVDVSSRLAEALGAEFKVYSGIGHLGPLMGRDSLRVAKETLDWLQS